MKEIQKTLEPTTGTRPEREAEFGRIQKELEANGDPVRVRMGVVMLAFLAGLFVGDEVEKAPVDNLELERWFRLPKGHERRIHGHRHAGVRIVVEGATLMLVLDAHRGHPGSYCGEDLRDYGGARCPPDEAAARKRRKVMRAARSKKTRAKLLVELEHRYLSGP